MLRAILVLFALFAAPAHAHDPSHKELDQWFDGLQSVKGPCCSNADGTVLKDVEWTTQQKPNSHYRVVIEGEWWDVPDEAVIKEPNLAGPAMVWPIYNRVSMEGGSQQRHFEIRCFMPGQMG